MYVDLFKTPVEKRAEMLKNIWLKKKGNPLNLDNPVTFTEKIQWYKTYYTHPDLHRIVDKVDFKKWISEKISKENLTAKLFRIWNSPEEVDFTGLPKKCVVKSNCRDTGKWVKIIENIDKENLSLLEKEIKENWFDVQQTLVNSFCSGYHQVKPKVFVEEFLPGETNIGLLDYKFFCFSGRVEFVCVIDENHKNEIGKAPVAFYNTDWELMNVTYKDNPRHIGVNAPLHFDAMKRIACELSKDFPFVRIDFTLSESNLYITELTFYPSGGWMNFGPEDFDRYLGDRFILPISKQ